MKMVILAWDCVMHDNHRLMPVKIGKGVRLITSGEYRAKKLMAETSLKSQWRPDLPLRGRVFLVARCFFPDKRKRDAGNYRKLITDALSGIAYADDGQLHSETWERAGIDTKNPRIEITLEAA